MPKIIKIVRQIGKFIKGESSLINISLKKISNRFERYLSCRLKIRLPSIRKS
jgi:hypothetical protein